VGLEVSGPLPPARDILSAFRMDKKFRSGVRFVFLEDVGRPTVVEGVTDDELRAILIEMGAPG
jgi:3-dehydroquinate synthetase